MSDLLQERAAQAIQAKAFKIYKFRECTENDSAMMDFGETLAASSESTREAFAQMDRSASAIGAETRCLFQGAGMSILYIWFKSGFPLIRHSHDVDCVYHITAGSLKIGTEELGPGDGFFVPALTPYTYTVGPKGMEMLEFRNSETCNMRLMGGNAAYWARHASKMREHSGEWEDEPRLSGIDAPFMANRCGLTGSTRRSQALGKLVKRGR